MNLWIRSQDRKILIPIDNALYIPQSRTGENFGIFYKDIMLGYYTKEERTLEVLDEIQRLIEDLQYIGYAIEKEKFCGYRPNVYEMQKEKI